VRNDAAPQQHVSVVRGPSAVNAPQGARLCNAAQRRSRGGRQKFAAAGFEAFPLQIFNCS
jgi:hypothetical protein